LSRGGQSIIESFKETIPTFCETVLSNGHRVGDEWVCANLQNDPISNKGSCNVRLTGEKAGCFIDHAEDAKGGPLELWKGIFGVSDNRDARQGMREWVENGRLPYDTGIYDPRASRYVPSGKEEELIPERDERGKIDELEKTYAHEIQVFRNWDDYARMRAGGMDLCNRKLSEEEWEKAKAEYSEKKALYDEYIRFYRSLWHAHRWAKRCAEIEDFRADVAANLAAYRGLSAGVFEWLIGEAYITLVNDPRGMEIAFPVTRETVFKCRPYLLLSEPIRTEELFSPYWAGRLHFCKNDCPVTEYLGMHLRWFRGEFGSAEGGWRYWPKGISSEPLIIGELTSAELVVLAESWDLIAFADVYELYRQEIPWAGIATRGTSNCRKIPADKFREGAVILTLLQNDPANQKWYDGIPLSIVHRLRRIIPPRRSRTLTTGYGSRAPWR